MGFLNIPQLKIGDFELDLIQGGMGVGISGARLASAVANEGGLGVIASVGLNLVGEKRAGPYEEASITAFREEIKLAHYMMNGKGALGVNIMHVLSNYDILVKTAVEENVDVIISGAGIPKDLPLYLREDSKTKLIPIVSSARLASIICLAWKRHGHLPDAVIVEGPKAGGHLGFSLEQLADEDFIEHGLERIVPEVVEALKPYETERKIPVIAAGGIFYGQDIRKFLELGASGVQMATRFVATHECDAPPEFKQAYLDSKEEDIIIIKSPVGMPGRAINNNFLKKVRAGAKIPVNCPYKCLTLCIPEKSPYCIARALVQARKGDLENGFAFSGANAWRCKEIVSVKQVFESLDGEYLEGKVFSG